MDTSNLPASVVYWNRPGNGRPANGYMMPLFPKTWFSNAPVAAQLFTCLDNALETGQYYLDVLRAAHVISLAAGTDLDDLAALFGLDRFDGESDGQLRVRIQATAQHGAGATTIPKMQDYLTSALGVPVVIQDVAPGEFNVTLLSNTPQYKSVVPLVKKAKAAGTKFTASMLVAAPSTTPATFGSFSFGDVPVGDSGIYVPLS